MIGAGTRVRFAPDFLRDTGQLTGPEAPTHVGPWAVGTVIASGSEIGLPEHFVVRFADGWAQPIHRGNLIAAPYVGTGAAETSRVHLSVDIDRGGDIGEQCLAHGIRGVEGIGFYVTDPDDEGSALLITNPFREEGGALCDPTYYGFQPTYLAGGVMGYELVWDGEEEEVYTVTRNDPGMDLPDPDDWLMTKVTPDNPATGNVEHWWLSCSAEQGETLDILPAYWDHLYAENSDNA